MLYIAGVRVHDPAELKIGRYDLSKSGRTASGKMTMDIVRAGVRRVDVTWRNIPDHELQKILSLIANNKPFFTLQYPDAGRQDSMVCYSGDISASLYHEIGGIRYWSDVSIPFIER